MVASIADFMSDVYVVPFLLFAVLLKKTSWPGICTFTFVLFATIADMGDFESYMWPWDLVYPALMGDLFLFWRMYSSDYYLVDLRDVLIIACLVGAFTAFDAAPGDAHDAATMIAEAAVYVALGFCGVYAATYLDRYVIQRGKGPLPSEREAMQATIEQAIELAREVKRGRKVATALIYGDTDHVLANSEQLLPNPFENSTLNVTDRAAPGIIRQFVKLDGAILIDGRGNIRTCGRYLHGDRVGKYSGLGTRHMSAIGITKKTEAFAIVISETDSHVRIARKGEIIAEIDPSTPTDTDAIADALLHAHALDIRNEMDMEEMHMEPVKSYSEEIEEDEDKVVF